MQKREEGTVERHYGAAARASEAERSQARRAGRPPMVAVTSSDLAREKSKVDELCRAHREALSASGDQGQEMEILVSVDNGKAR